MRKLFLLLVFASVVAVVGAGSATAGNLKSYEGASWYGKYLAVTDPTPLPCTSNSGEVEQLSFGVAPINVDAGHECGSQSETFIAINPTGNQMNVVAGANEIQRLPMRAMASTTRCETCDIRVRMAAISAVNSPASASMRAFMSAIQAGMPFSLMASTSRNSSRARVGDSLSSK